MVVGQRWPGPETVRVGYGTPGAVSVNKSGDIVTAKQHKIGGVINRGTSQLFPPLNPVNAELNTSALPLGQSEYTTLFLHNHPFGGVTPDLARALAIESQTIMSPATHDLQIGTRIAATNGVLMYAEDSFIKTWNIAEPSVSEEDVYLDMISPVLQVDAHGLVRTKDRLAVVSPEPSVNYFRCGEFMHVASARSGSHALASQATGDITLIDIEHDADTWCCKQPRGSLSGWNCVWPIDDNQAVWANRYTMAMLDFRTPSKTDSQIVLDYTDRQREIREVGVDSHGDIFALSSYEFLWISAGDRGYTPTMTVEHPIARHDWSTSLSVGRSRTNTLVTVASQISSLITAAFFGRSSEKLPVLMDDLYYLETWPTINPQSHITIETQNGFDIYSLGNDGGLFQQKWVEGGQSARDDLVDLPPEDPLVIIDSRAEEATKLEYTPWDYSHDGVTYRPFELIRSRDATDIYNFASIYQKLFGDPEAPDGEAQSLTEAGDDELSLDIEPKLAQLGVASAAELLDLCERQWLGPQRTRLSSSEAKRISRQITQMTREISEAIKDTRQVVYRTDSELGLGKEEQAVLDMWPTGDEESETFNSSQPSVFSQSSQSNSQWSQPFTQPAPAMSQPSFTQSSLMYPTLSQPRLASTKKRKHKRHKHHRH